MTLTFLPPRYRRLLRPVTEILDLLWQSCKSWMAHEPFRNSAVIAYYAIFSLPGLLLIIINVAGYFFGQDVVIDRVAGQVDAMIGSNTAQSVKDIIDNAEQAGDAGLTTLLGVMVLLFGATGVFYQVQQSLNHLWEVETKPGANFLKLVIDRLFSFGLVLTLCFLLLVSLMVSAALNALGEWISSQLSETVNMVVQMLDYLLSFGIIAVLFAAIFRFLPDAEIHWKDVWIGALVTAGLFRLAETVLAYYFGHSDPGSTYGAAGSVILLMLWVSYASLILLFGAEFTRNYANRFGGTIAPSEHARETTDDDAPAA